MADDGYVSLRIDLAPGYHAELLRQMEERGLSVTDLVRGALALDRYVWENRGGELLTRDQASGEVRQLVIAGAAELG